ncbi:MAG: OmpA family protein [Tannerella sp.]|jgi:outer membrane protein OmpA-like peptidoglycan-associated protein|nr:OmpA family protein [Tannerella sp.]
MKAKVLFLTFLVGAVMSLSAQQYEPQIGFSTENGSKTNFKKNAATDNMFITLAGGANILIGDKNGDANFGDRIAPQGALSIGKWYNPYLAFRLQINGGLMKNYSFITKTGVMQDYTWINPHVDIMWDVTNFWAPYKESKVFRFVPFVGMGYGHRNKMTDDAKVVMNRSESLSAHFGAQMLFRLSRGIDLALEGQYTLLDQEWNKEAHTGTRTRYHRVPQLMLGLNFNLGKKEFEVIEQMDYALLNDLNSQINALRAQNAELSKRPERCPDCPPPPVIPPARENVQNVVYFRLNKSIIDPHQEINISTTADYAKKHNLPIKLVGYADRKTGNPDYNKGLSERRARAVAKQLTEKYGVPTNRISIDWRGDEVQPYSVNEWNRVVIMNTDDK